MRNPAEENIIAKLDSLNSGSNLTSEEKDLVIGELKEFIRSLFSMPSELLPTSQS